MTRTLRYLGLVVLAASAWGLLAGEVGWISAERATGWIPHAVWAGAGLLAAGIVAGLLAPLVRRLRATRCRRCGMRVEAGRAYCMDHLQETVNEYRDRAHDDLVRLAGKED